jgi:hypothetical protein
MNEKNLWSICRDIWLEGGHAGTGVCGKKQNQIIPDPSPGGMQSAASCMPVSRECDGSQAQQGCNQPPPACLYHVSVMGGSITSHEDKVLAAANHAVGHHPSSEVPHSPRRVESCFRTTTSRRGADLSSAWPRDQTSAGQYAKMLKEDKKSAGVHQCRK